MLLIAKQICIGKSCVLGLHNRTFVAALNQSAMTKWYPEIENAFLLILVKQQSFSYLFQIKNYVKNGKQ